MNTDPNAPANGPANTSTSSGPGSTPSSTVDRKLLEILICPLTRGPLTYDAEAQELISERANLAFPIRDGIPIMLEFEAREL